MPDFDESAVAIVTLFETGMASAYPSVVRIYDNQQRISPSPATPWIRFTILGGGARMPEIGSRLADNLGRAIAQIFTPVGIGDSLSRNIATAVRDILQGVRVSDVQLYATEIQPVSQEPGAPWRQVNASTPFRFESMPA